MMMVHSTSFGDSAMTDTPNTLARIPNNWEVYSLEDKAFYAHNWSILNGVLSKTREELESTGIPFSVFVDLSKVASRKIVFLVEKYS